MKTYGIYRSIPFVKPTPDVAVGEAAAGRPRRCLWQGPLQPLAPGDVQVDVAVRFEIST